MPTTDDLLETAWGIIANAGWDGHDKTPGWQEAAVRWRDDYHRWLAQRASPGLKQDARLTGDLRHQVPPDDRPDGHNVTGQVGGTLIVLPGRCFCPIGHDHPQRDG